MPPASKDAPLKSIKTHRREVFRQIILPVGGGFTLLVILVAGVMLPPILPTPAHIATLSNIMVVIFLMLPTFLCMFGLYLLLAYFVFGIVTFNRVSARQLRRLNRLSETITNRTVDVTTAIDKRTLEARVKIAGVENAMDNAFKTDKNAGAQDDNEEKTT